MSVLVGDERMENLLSIHSSQFYDLIEIFRIGGYAPNTNYLFLGTTYPTCDPKCECSLGTGR